MQSGILPEGLYKNKPQLVLRSFFPPARVMYCLSLVCLMCFVFVSFRSQQSPWTAARQSSLSITNSWSLLKLTSQWCHPTNSSSVIPFSSCLQSFPASGTFQMSQFFALGGQSIGVSASASVLPMNSQDWFPLGWTGLISMKSKTTIWKHQFFSAQLSLWSNSHIYTWLLEKPWL